MPADYASLWCKSNHSFLEGASRPEELVDEARRLGVRGLALTERDGMHGAVRAHIRATEVGLPLLLGAQVSIEDGSSIVLLAENGDGYARLCRLLTRGRRRSPKGTSSVSWKEICEHSLGIVALWGGAPSLLSRHSFPEAIARNLKEAFEDRLFCMIPRHREACEIRRERRLRERAQKMSIPTVAAHEVLYHAPDRRPLQDVLTCIRHGVRLDSAGRRLQANAEHALRSPLEFSQLFSDDPESVYRTLEIAERCTFSLAQIRYRYPSEGIPGDRTSFQWLRELVFEGAQRRYRGNIPSEVIAQIDRELTLIDKLDYGGYFLTMWEIVRFCGKRGILCQGRGSAANSVVCYCLGITAIDPVRMGLLFERFLSMERAEPPDIDLDIASDRREEVIQHVYEKYGRDRAAMVANIVRYRARSAARDVGKALGIAETTLHRLTQRLTHGQPLDEALLAATGLEPALPIHRNLLHLVDEVLGFPRHLSIHPGGFLLGHRPVHDLVPVENATMPGRTVIQWDKNDVEALGLFKVDLLGLGALTQLDTGFRLLAQHKGIDVSMATIPQDDTATFDALCRADAVGVFQVESRAQMAMLPRLRPRCYYDLVVEVSIVRPGPITGGMVHPYLRRRNGEEPIDYPHPSLRPVLEKTLGIPIFQEQVMRLAMVAADYTPGEADQLRRDMAAWRRTGRMLRHREKLVSRMKAKGIAEEFAERIFQQICGFGEYGFPESHAASFALISYAAAWMKRHHPAVFLCATLNAQPMGFYSPASLVEDAKRHGVEIRGADVTRSGWNHSLEQASRGPHAFALRTGLRVIRGLGEAAGRRLEAERKRRPFRDLGDLQGRTRLGRARIERLAEAGALAPFGGNRRQMLWAGRGLEDQRATPALLPNAPPPGFEALDSWETIDWDYRTTHQSPNGHPLAPLRPALSSLGLPDSDAVAKMRHGRRIHYAGIVICRQRPGTASGVTFMTLEDETGFVNVILWRRVFEAHATLAKTASFLGITGKIQTEGNVVHLVADDLWVPQLGTRPRNAGSRDFR